MYRTTYRLKRATSLLFVCFWRDSSQWARASSFTRFLDHTQRRTTVGRTPLDEWSASRRDLYLTTHNTHNRQASIPPVGLEPTISACERQQTYALNRAATGSGLGSVTTFINLELQGYNHCIAVQTLNPCSVTIRFNTISSLPIDFQISLTFLIYRTEFSTHLSLIPPTCVAHHNLIGK